MGVFEQKYLFWIISFDQKYLFKNGKNHLQV